MTPAIAARWRPWLLPAVCIAAVAVGHLLASRPGHAWGDDFAQYLLHARNLALGIPYAQTGYLYDPAAATVGPPSFPPATAALLAPFYRACGNDPTRYKPLMAVCFAGFLAALAWGFQGRMGGGWRAVLVALVGVNWYALALTDAIGSEPLFLLLLYLALGWADRPMTNTSARRDGAVLGLLVYSAYAARTLGGLALAAVAIHALVDRSAARPALRRRLLATATVFIALALAQSWLIPGQSRYLDQFAGWSVAALVSNAAGYAQRWAAFFSNGRAPATAVLLWIAVTALAYGELRRRWRAGEAWSVFELFAALYAAALLLWPSYQAERYLFPLLPIWLGLATAYAARLWQGTPRPRWVLVALGVAIATSGAMRWQSRAREPGIERGQGLFRYVAEHLPARAIVAGEKPRVMALLGGRRAAGLPDLLAGDEALDAYLDRIAATHLVVVEADDALGSTVRPERLADVRRFARRRADDLTRVYSDGSFTLYRLPRASGAAY